MPAKSRPPQEHPFYTNEDLDQISPDELLKAGPIKARLAELRAMELDKARNFFWLRHRWLEEGLPITFHDCTVTKEGGHVKLEAKGKTQPKDSKLPDLKGRRCLVIPIDEEGAFDAQIDKILAPFFYIRGAVNILQLILGIPDEEGVTREEIYQKFFRDLGEELPPYRRLS